MGFLNHPHKIFVSGDVFSTLIMENLGYLARWPPILAIPLKFLLFIIYIDRMYSTLKHPSPVSLHAAATNTLVLFGCRWIHLNPHMLG
jgi:hypothetical protein